MDKNLTQGIVVVAGVLLLNGEDREILGQAPKPTAAMPEHAGDRQAEAQMLRMSRATQVATPSAMLVFGAPESPAR